MVFDDGVTTRLGKNHFLMTTPQRCCRVLAWLEEWLQTECLTEGLLHSVTEHISTIVLVGPKSRQLLKELVTDIDLSKGAFPFMHSRVRRSTAYLCASCEFPFQESWHSRSTLPGVMPAYWERLGRWTSL